MKSQQTSKYQYCIQFSQLSDGYSCATIGALIEKLWSLEVGVLLKFISEQNKIPEQIWTLSIFPMGNWMNLEYRYHKSFHKLSSEG
jgi:hypothetical protein